ncbi:DUF6850 family outer membrane beta-barrel protein [Sphingobacterium athyrii]|uniref:DUF6850 domain-containing protein n=1 Tax=Sphingobacterium athyrii TaxID=2152717 RepID=A0A363NZ88_9SPHI|nr:DUF6850 family outer membrane beta-barrel protein [Sphingobacterium athyrii]PUV26134.1 hypothetical protein DCO56_04005 [Sphingobacterium athyrii]
MKSIEYIASATVYFLSCIAVQGQIKNSATVDSLAPTFYWYQPSSIMSHDMAVRNRVWISEEMKNKSSILGIRQSIAKGSFQPAQGADGLKQTYIYTEGKTKWRKTNFWGRFSYDHSSEDSTALRHQSRWNEDAPVYFGSFKKNKYNRETYKLDAGMQHAFLNNRLPITLGIDYRLGSHYSNNDPRGDVKDMNLQFELSVGHNLPKISYHLSGIWGYGSERVNVGYKNEKYTKNTEDPLYVNWIMNGFGNAREKISEINYDDVINRTGIGGHLLLKPNGADRIYLNGRYINEKQSFRRNDNSKQTYSLLNDYTKDISSVDFLWSRQMHNQTALKLALIGQIEEGKDFNYTYLSNNYTYQQNQLQIKGLFDFRQFQAEGGITVRNLRKKDGVTSNAMDIDQIKAALGLNHRFRINERSDLLGSFCFSKQWSPANKLSVSDLNTGNFAKQILYQDYLYETASSSTWTTSWVWMAHRGKTDWSVQFQLDYQHRGDLTSLNYDVSALPGKDWLLGKLGVSYIF